MNAVNKSQKVPSMDDDDTNLVSSGRNEATPKTKSYSMSQPPDKPSLQSCLGIDGEGPKGDCK